MKTVIIQSFRTHDIPAWIARCLASVKAWAHASGHDHWMTDDSCFRLCGADYLSKVGDNKRSITNLARLELIKLAHAQGYERAIWMDADIFVFDPESLRFDLTEGCAFVGETWVWHNPPRLWTIDASVNNSVVLAMDREPDIDFIIQTTRYVARHKPITSNYQVGGDIVKGLRRILRYRTLDNVGMFSQFVVHALATGREDILDMQARHGTSVHAANLCASEHHAPQVPEATVMRAMDLLETTRGGVINERVAGQPTLDRF